MTAVEVCPICDIAGCHHIRERKAKMTHQTSSETTFNDEELIVRLRVGVPTVWEKQAADRIEALVKDRDQAWEVAHAATDRGMRAEAALAAQIETDAGIARHRHAVSEDAFQKGLGAENRHCALEAIHIADKIADQPHDRTALDRMLAEAREKALREAADMFDADSNIAQTILALIEAPDGSR